MATGQAAGWALPPGNMHKQQHGARCGCVSARTRRGPPGRPPAGRSAGRQGARQAPEDGDRRLLMPPGRANVAGSLQGGLGTDRHTCAAIKWCIKVRRCTVCIVSRHTACSAPEGPPEPAAGQARRLTHRYQSIAAHMNTARHATHPFTASVPPGAAEQNHSYNAYQTHNRTASMSTHLTMSALPAIAYASAL